MLKKIVLLTLVCGLAGCMGDNMGESSNIGNAYAAAIAAKSNKTTYTTEPTIKSFGKNLPYTMGGSYDTMSGYPAAATSCLNAAFEPNAVSIIDPQATLDFSQEQSLEQVENALGISIAVTIGWGPFSITNTYQYANSSQDDAYTLNLNYIYQYAGTAVLNDNTQLGESALTPAAQDVLESPPAFRNMCGNRFISQMNAGAEVLFRLQLQFNSSEDKNYFTSTFSGISGLNSVISLILANIDSNYSLSASGMQVGGDPSQLKEIFLAAGGYEDNGYMTVNCNGASGKSSCIQLVDNVIAYTTAIAPQLETTNNYYLSNPTFSSWHDIGINPGKVAPSPQVLAAIESINSQYNADQNTYQFINEYRNMLANESCSAQPCLSESMDNHLTDLSALYQQVLYIYSMPTNHIMNCYSTFISNNCANIWQNISQKRAQILATYPKLLSLLDYIKHNQYLSELIINPENYGTAACGMYPITNESNSLYLVNCNGQTSGSFDPTSGISIIPESADSLQVNNLNYTYVESSGSLQQSNQFTYQFSQPLTPKGGFYSQHYYGTTNICINNCEESIVDHGFTLTNAH